MQTKLIKNQYTTQQSKNNYKLIIFTSISFWKTLSLIANSQNADYQLHNILFWKTL